MAVLRPGSRPRPTSSRRGPALGLAGLLLLAVLATWASARSGQPGGPVHGTVETAARLWAWDGTAYSSTAVGPAGPGSTDAEMAFDRRHQALVVWDHGCTRLVYGFTGGCQERVNRTWTLEGGVWKAHSPRNSPVAVRRGVMVYDGRLEEVVYVNGAAQVWAWDGGDWSAVARSGAPRVVAPDEPSRVAPSAFAAGYDESRESLVVMRSDRTYSWDGRLWTSHPGGVELNEVRSDPHLVFDRGRSLLTLIGSRRTWSWDGSGWSAEAQPELRAGTPAYDPLSGGLMFLETSSDCDSTSCATVTWLRGGGGWRALRDLPGPRLSVERSGYFLPPLAYDDSRGLMLLFAGGR